MNGNHLYLLAPCSDLLKFPKTDVWMWKWIRVITDLKLDFWKSYKKSDFFILYFANPGFQYWFFSIGPVKGSGISLSLPRCVSFYSQDRVKNIQTKEGGQIILFLYSFVLFSVKWPVVVFYYRCTDVKDLYIHPDNPFRGSVTRHSALTPMLFF